MMTNKIWKFGFSVIIWRFIILRLIGAADMKRLRHFYSRMVLV